MRTVDLRFKQARVYMEALRKTTKDKLGKAVLGPSFEPAVSKYKL
jgi:hypothetical protein